MTSRRAVLPPTFIVYSDASLVSIRTIGSASCGVRAPSSNLNRCLSRSPPSQFCVGARCDECATTRVGRARMNVSSEIGAGTDYFRGDSYHDCQFEMKTRSFSASMRACPHYLSPDECCLRTASCSFSVFEIRNRPSCVPLRLEIHSNDDHASCDHERMRVTKVFLDDSIA
jgi:hypothetical protein